MSRILLVGWRGVDPDDIWLIQEPPYTVGRMGLLSKGECPGKVLTVSWAPKGKIHALRWSDRWLGPHLGLQWHTLGQMTSSVCNCLVNPPLQCGSQNRSKLKDSCWGLGRLLSLAWHPGRLLGPQSSCFLGKTGLGIIASGEVLTESKMTTAKKLLGT